MFKAFATLLSLALIVLTTVCASAANDLTVETTGEPSPWAAEAVSRADSLGLLPSALNGEYKRNITRAEFCTLAVLVHEKAIGAEITRLRDFTDTTDRNVRKIGGLGIVQGVGNGAFNPDGEITRQEAAVILSNLASSLGKPLPVSEPTFADRALIDSWAVASVGQMQSSGIMAGTGNNNFTPKGEAGKYTREQSISTLLRLWDALGLGSNTTADTGLPRLNIAVGDKTFTATMTDNSSAKALIELLSRKPLTIQMQDYANFEKVGELPQHLPTNDEQINTVAGDLILYQGNRFVIYYSTNSWSLTRLGKIEDVTSDDLKRALGSSDVTVTLSIAK
ncbi:MAG: S-layer homology domain-containing protein [Clostridiales bacterium]|jgi:hypothetical protein|nr:S-layer homology domain-containing protein [Clostridiales bacterium]